MVLGPILKSRYGALYKLTKQNCPVPLTGFNLLSYSVLSKYYYCRWIGEYSNNPRIFFFSNSSPQLTPPPPSLPPSPPQTTNIQIKRATLKQNHRMSTLKLRNHVFSRTITQGTKFRPRTQLLPVLFLIVDRANKGG